MFSLGFARWEHHVKVINKSRDIALNTLRGFPLMGDGDVLIVDVAQTHLCPENVNPDALALVPINEPMAALD